jgi:antitoxin VapB
MEMSAVRDCVGHGVNRMGGSESTALERPHEAMYIRVYQTVYKMEVAMALSIRDKRTEAAVRELAKVKQQGLTETIRDAVESELQRTREATPLIERVRALQERYARYPETGEKADKAFFDDLGGDL